MGKKKYYNSASEEKIVLKKLVGLDKEKATYLYDATCDGKPPQRLMQKRCRDLTFIDIPLMCLEYIWIGCESSTIKDRLLAKASYLVRINDDTNPRKHLLFTLDENMEVVKDDENEMLEKLYPQFEDESSFKFSNEK